MADGMATKKLRNEKTIPAYTDWPDNDTFTEALADLLADPFGDVAATGAVERRKWLDARRSVPLTPAVQKAVEKWYGAARAKSIRHVEAFEICEYGRRATEAELRKLFPFFE